MDFSPGNALIFPYGNIIPGEVLEIYVAADRSDDPGHTQETGRHPERSGAHLRDGDPLPHRPGAGQGNLRDRQGAEGPPDSRDQTDADAAGDNGDDDDNDDPTAEIAGCSHSDATCPRKTKLRQNSADHMKAADSEGAPMPPLYQGTIREAFENKEVVDLSILWILKILRNHRREAQISTNLQQRTGACIDRNFPIADILAITHTKRAARSKQFGSRTRLAWHPDGPVPDKKYAEQIFQDQSQPIIDRLFCALSGAAGICFPSERANHGKDQQKQSEE